MHKSQGLAVGISALLILSFTLTESPLSAQAEWTVLIYMAGDNNLEVDALEDINEMESTTLNDGVSVIVQIDRTDASALTSWGYSELMDDTSNGDWRGARRYLISHDTDSGSIRSRLLADMGEVDMADPAVLIDFVTWGVKNHPASHYALILWDHGGGYTGLNWDFTNNDYMTMTGLRGALATIVYNTGKKIDVVGFDMCYMATFEVDYQIAPYASIRVASQESIPNDGWDYERLLEGLAATPSPSPVQFAQHAVSSFHASRSDGSDDSFDTYYHTLSAVDLEEYATVVSAADALVNALSSISTDIVAAAASEADYYGSKELMLSGRFSDFIDFSDFAYLIGQKASSEAGPSLVEAIESVVIEERHGSFHDPPGASSKSPTGTNGISIYFPKGNLDLLYPSQVRFGEDFHWADYLCQIHTGTPQENVPTLILASTSMSTTDDTALIRGYTGAEFVVKNQIFRNQVAVAGKAVPVNSADGMFQQSVALSCGMNTIEVTASNEKGKVTRTVAITRICTPAPATEQTPFMSVNATMQAPARLNYARADSVRRDAEGLLKKAQERGLPTSQVEELMKEGEALLKRAQELLVGKNFIAANNYALKAFEKYNLAQEMLHALLT